ncbi:MAG: CerR family C-terminal domain-containing protein [Verrucomicrobia bacterium]|nr:CerR family C-terminal domain-containing protein [Verrucomicrobiota bacterium]
MVAAAQLKNDTSAAQTRQALIEAGGAVFAEIGFHNATVREICRRAGANIAAVHYHFGDKEALYRDVLAYYQTRAHQKFPLDLGLKPGASAPERLRAFVRAYLLRIFDHSSDAWHGKLISREMIDPTSALDAIIVERIRPQAQHLAGIVAELVGGQPDPELVRLCSFSVVSQCLFYHHCQPVLCRLFPDQKYDAEDIEQLAAHITEFSLAAVRAAARPRSSKDREAEKPLGPKQSALSPRRLPTRPRRLRHD